MRRHGRADRGPLDRAPDEDGRPRHGPPRLRGGAAPQEAPRRRRGQARLRREADADAAPAAEDPALRAGQGAGPAPVVPRDAVLARRLGRERRGDAARPDLALRARGLARRRGARAGRVSRRRPLAPRDRHRDRGLGPAAPPRRGRDRRPADDALLRPVGRHRALRRRDPGDGGARPRRDPRLRRRAGRAARDRRLPCRARRRAGRADGVLARGRAGLQRQPGGRRGAGRARRALPRRAPAGVPDAGRVGRGRARAGPGRDHDADRPAGDRRRDQPRRLRRPALGRALHGLRAGLRRDGRQGDGALLRPDRGAGRPHRQGRGAAPGAQRGPQGGRGPLRLPAERGSGRHRRVPVGVREPARHAAADGRRGLRRGRPRHGGRPARRGPDRRRGPGDGGEGRRPRAGGRDGRGLPVAGRDRGRLGPRAGAGAIGRARRLRAGPALRQRLRRAAAGLRLRGRPDAPDVRGRLRPDARLRRVLPLAGAGLRRRCGAALRDARRAGVHARQAVGRVRRVLARAADRRPAERLPLRGEQPVRGDAGQAPLGRGDGDARDPAAGEGGALQGPARSSRRAWAPGARCRWRTGTGRPGTRSPR